MINNSPNNCNASHTTLHSNIGQESPSPKDFAVAIFGDSPIVGVQVGSLDSNSGKKYSLADSFKSCINHVISVLPTYKLHPTLLSNKQSLTEIRKVNNKFAEGHKSYAAGRSNFIYCEKCLNNSNKEGEFACCVIAIVSPYKGELEEPSHAACLQVDAIFPHCSQCDVTYSERRNYTMDKERGGPGWMKFPFPAQVIVGETYKNQVDRLNNIPEDGDHCGMYIYLILCCVLACYFLTTHRALSLHIHSHKNL